MSITVNEKGSVQQRVTLQKRGRGKMQHVMLNDVLINKSENYHIQCGRFLTNHIPEIMQNKRVLCKILPRYDNGVPLIPPGFQDDNDGYEDAPRHRHFLSIYKYEPSTFSSAGVCEKFGQYIRKFNFVLNIWGAQHGVGANDIARHAIITNINQQEPYDLDQYVVAADIVQYISTGFEADGAMMLYLSSEFLSNFYIQFDDVFARLIGFPSLIYSDVNIGVQTMSTQDGIDELINGAVGQFALAAGAIENINLLSIRSIFLFDERLSIDIEISLPISQSIDVLNGVEKHTFILSRFMVTDYKSLECIAEQKGGVILSKAILSDKVGCGVVDLVMGKPAAHTAQLLNGKIQSLDMRLVLRYKDYYFQNQYLKYRVADKILEFDDYGLYDILLQFNKKI
jgi:hypothetical protein